MSEMADRVEQFANCFVPKVKVLTACLVSAQRWAEIDLTHPDAVAIRKEIEKIDPEITRMLHDLVNLAEDCKPYRHGEELPNAAPGLLADEQRIAAALRKMTAVVKECTKQEVLLQKELELVKVKKEVEALRIVATLLRDEEDWVREAAQPTLTVTGPSLVKAGAVIDSPPASSSQRGRWRNAGKRFFPGIPIRKHS
ncbi:MAG: hypothetical protein WBQ46_19045 [Terriglobales bacterium]